MNVRLRSLSFMIHYKKKKMATIVKNEKEKGCIFREAMLNVRLVKGSVTYRFNSSALANNGGNVTTQIQKES